MRAGFKVLTVGIDNAWREIDIPFPEFASIDLEATATAMVGEAYVMLCSSSTSGLEVICLETGQEQLSRIKIPNGFFSYDDLFGVVLLAWGESLALVSIIRGEDEVHILVLEDHKNNRWAEKEIVIPLKFLDSCDKEHLTVGHSPDNGLLMIYDLKDVFLLDVTSGTIRWSHHAPQALSRPPAYYYLVPSLQNPKGDETKH